MSEVFWLLILTKMLLQLGNLNLQLVNLGAGRWSLLIEGGGWHIYYITLSRPKWTTWQGWIPTTSWTAMGGQKTSGEVADS